MNDIALSSGPEVCPLGRTELDNAVLLANLNDLFNMQPSRKLDFCPIHLSEAARLLVILAEVQSPGPMDLQPENILRDLPPGVMQFIQYSFLVLCDNELPALIVRNTRLEVITVGTCTLVVGPLAHWFDAIVAIHPRTDSHFRLLLNKVLLFFEVTEGLALVFDGYRKVAQPDRTFCMEKK